jgi:hypothetical protein
MSLNNSSRHLLEHRSIVKLFSIHHLENRNKFRYREKPLVTRHTRDVTRL